MKNRILHPAVSALALMILSGCGQKQPEGTTPPASNPAAQQPIPGAEATNNIAIPPAPTNSPATNAPTAPNQ